MTNRTSEVKIRGFTDIAMMRGRARTARDRARTAPGTDSDRLLSRTSMQLLRMFNLIVTSLAVFCIAGSLSTVGCRQHELGVSHPLDYTDDQIQQIVERKLEEQTESADGLTRWQQYQDDEYQEPTDVERDRRRVELERIRSARARQILDAGPLRLEQALTIAMELNDEVLAAREEIRAVGGDELIVQSRFLPTLTYVLDIETINPNDGGAHGDTDNALRAEMTLFEFGRDNPEDVTLRADQRGALFGYENIVSRVLSDVRLQFFTVLLRQKQLATRQELMEQFQVRLEQVRELLAAGRALRVDELTAELNVLNEMSRINSLGREIRRRKIDLLHVIGLPAGLADFQIDGVREGFDMAIDQAVQIALLRSTAIAQARATVYEQARVVKQIWWEDGPSFAGQFGWRDAGNRAGLELSSDDGTHAVSAFSEGQLDGDPGSIEDSADRLDAGEEGVFAALNMELPLFTGFAHEGRELHERSLLAAARHDLRNTVDLTELDVRRLFETVLEQREEVNFQSRTVDLEKLRLDIQEQRKDENLITDDQLETFRNRFFDAQDALFVEQIALVKAIENLRAAMRYFDPTPVNQGGVEP
ncbi:MAG: hypothetical protein CMJ49_03170 [Planctomycetaceae bacterium]|nr:hypothetical protein [Planctomycetaceae bacterium]